MKIMIKIIGGLTAILLLFGFGFSWRDLQRGSLPPAYAINALVGSSVIGSQQQSAAQVFRSNYYRILEGYEQPLKSKELKYAAMSGLMASLGDPHTAFLEPREAQQLSLETDGQFVGVGARLNPDPAGAKMAVVFEGGPAYSAGARAGDLVTQVDGKSIAGLDIDGIVDKIRGKEGTMVKLQIVRSGEQKPLTFNIRRSTVITPTVESTVIKDQNVGLISVSIFSEHTPDQFDTALVKLLRQSVSGIVVDLRDNPGGRLDSVVEMLSRFKDDGIAVTMKGRHGDTESVRLYSGLQRKVNIPIVVLINESSASASEIFAGVMRDYGIATLVGTHSYGKFSVQNIWTLQDQSTVKITIAKYYLPSGASFTRKVDPDGIYLSGGIKPDFEAEDPEDVIAFGQVEGDPQLKRAIEVIQSHKR